MGVLRLPPVAELCDGALLPVRDEDRVEPKALDPSLHFRNATAQGGQVWRVNLYDQRLYKAF